LRTTRILAEIDDETSGTESYDICDSADGTLLSDHKLKDTEYHLRSGSPLLIEDDKTVSDNIPTTIGIYVHMCSLFNVHMCSSFNTSLKRYTLQVATL